MATIEFTSAPSGTGKTFERCARFLADRWLPSEAGVHYSNFPVFPEKMADFVIARNPDMHRGELLRRIHLIPQAELDRWRSEASGPWDYFHDLELDGAHIAIDEIHNFVHAASRKDYVQRWKEWAGELRHRGCTVEFLSQHETKVHSLIRNEAGLKRTLFNGEERRDPWFRIRMEDWYNLRAGFITKAYRTTIFATEHILVNGRWKESHTHRFTLGPPYFDLYDSYSAPIAGGRKANGKLHPFQTRTRTRLLGWFFVRNWETLGFRILAVVLIVLALTHATWLMRQFFGLMSSFVPKHASTVQTSPATAVAAGAPESGAGQGSAAASPAGGMITAPPAPDAFARLQKELDEAKAQQAKLAEKLKAAEEERTRSLELVAITDRMVLFRAGQAVQLGELIEFGPFKGRRLREIINARHYVVLDDGTRLYLAH